VGKQRLGGGVKSHEEVHTRCVKTEEELKEERMQHDPSQPPLIPETLLKRRRNLEELALRRVEHIKSQGKVCCMSSNNTLI
jgi:hypothetical protein